MVEGALAYPLVVGQRDEERILLVPQLTQRACAQGGEER
jgi:hypothetical protein